MKIPACFVLSLLAILPTIAFSQSLATKPDYAAIGRAAVTEISQHQWRAVEARFDQRMKDGLPAQKLASVWQQITAQAGAFQHIAGVMLREQQGYHVALVACQFANTDLDAKVVMDSSGKIAGLFFVPPPAPAAPASGKQPDYEAIGRATVTEISQRQWKAVEARFDQRMKAAIPQSKLSATWRQITAQAGAFQRIIGITLSEESGYHVALVHCAFANAGLDAKVVMDATGKIAGLFFVPPAS